MKRKVTPVSIDRCLEVNILKAKLVILWERVWSAVFPLAAVAGAFVLAAVSGVLELLPREAHYAVLGGFLIGAVVSARSLFFVQMPQSEAALQQIEAASGIAHQPASSYRDQLAGNPKDQDSYTLWRVHKERIAKQIRALRSGAPRSALSERDRFGLRYVLVLMIGVFIVLDGGNWPDRFQQALRPAYRAEIELFMDAWIAQPAYTGKAPIFLARGSTSHQDAFDLTPEFFKVAANSELIVRLNGALNPTARIQIGDSRQQPAGSQLAFKSMDPTVTRAENDRGARELRLVLGRPQQVAIIEAKKTIAVWNFTLIDDNKPQVRIFDLGQTADALLRFSYEASDDYGLLKLSSRFKLIDKAVGAKNLALNSKLFPPPDFEIDLPRVDPKKAEGRVFRDLLAHPWAGMKVKMRIIARDAAGQSAAHEGAPEIMVMPVREFNEPLARAVIEQRALLISDLDNAGLVLRVINALTAYPEKMIKQTGVFLGLRIAHHMLARAEMDEDYRDVVDLLWSIALSIEDKTLSIAGQDLRKLRRELSKALFENAPPERIAKLMKKMREAMGRYMHEIAKQMLHNQPDVQPFQPRAHQIVSSSDLLSMMDQIEKLARAGERDAARKLLSEFENIMENLRTGNAPRAPRSDTPILAVLEELAQMMRNQQELMDETFRMPDGRHDGSESLALRQGAMGDILGKLMEALRDLAIDLPGSFGLAEGKMRGAEGALREGSRDEALGEQAEAMSKMREGMQAIVQELMRRGTGKRGNFAYYSEGYSEGRPNRGNFDPLGRPVFGEQQGPRKDMVPGKAMVGRAREILRALRDRYSDAHRPKLELDYIERLLRDVY